MSEVELQSSAPRGLPPAFAALVAPQAGMERQARTGSARLAFVIALVCSLLAAFAQAAHVDAKSATLEKLEKAGTLQTMSDKQLEDATRNAARLYQVGRVAVGALETPVFLLLGGLAVLGLSWFLRAKVKGRAVFPVAAAALLPSAIANLLDAISAFQQPSLPLAGATLSPRNLSLLLTTFGYTLAGPWLKLGNALDFFSLWGALLMGYGIAAAAEVPPRRALIAVLCGWVFWRLLTNVAMGG